MYASFMDDYMPITHGVKSGLGKNDWEEWIIDLFNNGNYKKAKVVLKRYEKMFPLSYEDMNLNDYEILERYLIYRKNYDNFVKLLEKWYFKKGV